MNETLQARLNKPLKLVSEMSSDERFSAVNQFQTSPSNRILIAGLLISGEGLDLSKCSDCIIMERHWNPMKEEQAESRFINMYSKVNKVNVNYPVAIGTSDEILAKIVEQKRAQFSNVMDGTNIKWNESAIISELTAELLRLGRSAWS